jgi:hypothetical protein
MKLDRFLDERRNLFAALACSNAAWQIRDIGSEAIRTLLDDNQVLHL